MIGKLGKTYIFPLVCLYAMASIILGVPNAAYGITYNYDLTDLYIPDVLVYGPYDQQPSWNPVTNIQINDYQRIHILKRINDPMYIVLVVNDSYPDLALTDFMSITSGNGLKVSHIGNDVVKIYTNFEDPNMGFRDYTDIATSGTITISNMTTSYPSWQVLFTNDSVSYNNINNTSLRNALTFNPNNNTYDSLFSRIQTAIITKLNELSDQNDTSNNYLGNIASTNNSIAGDVSSILNDTDNISNNSDNIASDVGSIQNDISDIATDIGRIYSIANDVDNMANSAVDIANEAADINDHLDDTNELLEGMYIDTTDYGRSETIDLLDNGVVSDLEDLINTKAPFAYFSHIGSGMDTAFRTFENWNSINTKYTQPGTTIDIPIMNADFHTFNQTFDFRIFFDQQFSTFNILFTIRTMLSVLILIFFVKSAWSLASKPFI